MKSFFICFSQHFNSALLCINNIIYYDVLQRLTFTLVNCYTNINQSILNFLKPHAFCNFAHSMRLRKTVVHQVNEEHLHRQRERDDSDVITNLLVYSLNHAVHSLGLKAV